MVTVAMVAVFFFVVRKDLILEVNFGITVCIELKMDSQEWEKIGEESLLMTSL